MHCNATSSSKAIKWQVIHANAIIMATRNCLLGKMRRYRRRMEIFVMAARMRREFVRHSRAVFIELISQKNAGILPGREFWGSQAECPKNVSQNPSKHLNTVKISEGRGEDKCAQSWTYCRLRWPSSEPCTSFHQNSALPLPFLSTENSPQPK